MPFQEVVPFRGIGLDDVTCLQYPELRAVGWPGWNSGSGPGGAEIAELGGDSSIDAAPTTVDEVASD